MGLFGSGAATARAHSLDSHSLLELGGHLLQALGERQQQLPAEHQGHGIREHCGSSSGYIAYMASSEQEVFGMARPCSTALTMIYELPAPLDVPLRH